MSEVSIQLLGGAVIRSADEVVTGSAAQRHRVALLAVLVMAGDSGASREKLIGLLWPENDETRARNLLNQSVHALRRKLGADVIFSIGDNLQLNAERVSSDVTAFEAAVAADDLESAVERYAGPFLDGFYLPGGKEFEHWVEDRRRRLQTTYRELLENQAEAAEARGNAEAAVHWWHRLAAQDRYGSEVILSLMRALEAAGRRGDAIAQAEVHVAFLREELSAEPNPSVLALAERMRKNPTEPTPIPPRSRSVAVLPFLNLSADSENEYFADGVTEDVIAQLSQISDLMVISRTSVMPFKKREQGAREIAAKLKVATLLDGSVRRVGDRVRIVAHLIDAETDRHLWSETYDHQLSDIFAIQTDVALHIAGALEAELSPGERTRLHRKPTSDIEAYQLYLQGRHYLNQLTEKGFETAIEYFERAIEKDPDYALAYAMLALVYAEMGAGVAGGALEPIGAYGRAREAAAKALELDSGLAEAYSMMGLIKFSCDFDYSGAEQQFKRALELNPGSADTLDIYGRMLAGLERYDEALEVQGRAHDLDPLEHRLDLVSTLLRAGRYEKALQPAKRIVEIEPHFAHARATLGWVYFKLGRFDEGLAELRKAISLSPDNTMYQAQLGQALALVGDIRQARQILQELEESAKRRYDSPYHLAYVYTGLGEHDRAMDHLEQAYEERGGALYGIKGSFLFSTLRSHPRFKALLAKMNLA